MRPVSDALTAAVRGSHRMAARARVLLPGATGVNPDGVEIPILSGSDVQFDSTADVRATLDLTTTGAGWDPTPGKHMLQPYGNEIFVERGVQHQGASIEWVSQGYYRIWSVRQDNAPNGQLRIAAKDRMSGIIDSKLTAPRQFKADRSARSVVEELVTEVYPAAQIDWQVDDRVIGRDQVTEQDRWKFLNDLVTGMAAIWHWDYRGYLVVAPAPNLAVDPPVFRVNGGSGGVLVSAARSISRDSVYNAVVATAEGADDKSPAKAIVYDNDANSPTYWHGPFGQVPEFYSSPTITTQGQAEAVGRAELAKRTGLPYSMDLKAVPHPGLEDNDVVQVDYPGRSEHHIVDKLTMPLTADDAMSASTRVQTAVGFGVM